MKTYAKIITMLLTFAISAVSLTSCYDDSELRESIKDLQTRVQLLEQKMADNIAALQSVISVGSISSWSYNMETGKGVITLVDGNKIEISQKITGYSTITVQKDDDGVYYWAISRDGVNIPLTIDNKKVPVSVTPAMKISADNVWLISVDGGKTWVNTGISYYTGEDEEEEPDTPVTEVVSVFEKAEKDGNHLVLTLAGGEQIRVEIVGEAVFKTAEETLWFSRAGMEKSVVVEMSHVKAYTITEKPEGWKARIEDSYLIVTSPEDLTESQTEGTVKVLALFDNGANSEILCLEVAYEPCLTLSRANGVVSVKLSEHTADDFTGYVLVGWKKEDYTPEAAVEWLNANAASVTSCQGSATYNLENLIPDYSLIDEYVVFAVPYLPADQVAQGTEEYQLSDIVSIETIAVSNAWEIRNLRFNSAELFAVLDLSEFYGGFLDYERWNAQAREDMIEILSEEGGEICTNILYEGPVNGFPDGSLNVSTLLPATEYVVWYVPVQEDGKYVAEDFVEHRFTTPDIASDSSIPAPAYKVSDITSSGFVADVTPAASYYRTYAAIVKSTAIAELDEKGIVNHLIKVNSYSEGTAVNTVSSASFAPEDEVYLLAVSINEDGGFGALVKEKIELKQLVFTETVGVSVSGYECDEEGTATLSLTFTGSPVSMTYMVASYTYYTNDVLQKLLALDQLGDSAVTVDVSKLGGKLVLPGLTSGVDYTFYAIVTDADGNHSYISTYDFTPAITISYITSDSADYEYGMPQLSGTLSSKKYTMTVTMPETCQRYWLFCGDPEYLSGDVYANSDKMVNMGLELLGETLHMSSTVVTYSNVQSYTRIYMVWQDNNNKYHAIYEFNPNK